MSEDHDLNYTIVEYMSDHSGYKCGYCKSTDTNYSHGMWAHRMAVGDYQALINRGWRRSGKYCYKPTMDKTCCPHYTIKCEVPNFVISKSQKKVLKRMHKFLSYGKVDKNISEGLPQDMEGSVEEKEFAQFQPKRKNDKNLTVLQIPHNAPNKEPISIHDRVKENMDKTIAEDSSCNPESSMHSNLKSLPPNITIAQKAEKTTHKSIIRSGTGADPSKPVCKKAKLLRREKRINKPGPTKNSLQATSTTNNSPKTLKDLLNEPLPDNPAHRLELRLVRGMESTGIFQKTFKESYKVFLNYQMTIHNEPEEECEQSSFKSFLVDSPLMHWKPRTGPPFGYGSFHQQYWLDDELIAVGVIDILPQCVSSVYLYYNPKYSFLSLGTYSSLREIALVNELNVVAPNLKWYYMGYYIHSCPKMRYKGKFFPSYLLCPESYSWEPIERSIPKLEVSKYSKLSDQDASLEEDVDVNKVLCLYDGTPMLYANYCQLTNPNRHQREANEKEVREYCALTGTQLACTMLLCRS